MKSKSSKPLIKNNLAKKLHLIRNDTSKILKMILIGSLCVAAVLVTLLFVYDTLHLHQIRLRTIVGLMIILYILIGLFFTRQGRVGIANGMIISLYGSLAFYTLLYWGLQSVTGLFTISFVIILTGVLFGSRAILPVAVTVAVALLAIQSLHSFQVVTPNLNGLDDASSYLDVFAYTAVLGIFSLVIWISNRQMESSLYRAKKAELIIRTQKDDLASELEKESSKLRQAQLKELQQLYKFATLGQATAATLHELSNHLSVLNMDLNDLRQQNKNSKAIKAAEESIDQINFSVRQVRHRLDSYDDDQSFKIGPSIKRTLKDHAEKFERKDTKLVVETNGLESTKIQGDPLAFSQVLSILLNNSLDACDNVNNAKVLVNVYRYKVTGIKIKISDNGSGIDRKIEKKLFTPKASTKPNGLGVGLYIAKNLTESQLNGRLYLENIDYDADNHKGASFIIQLPILK